MLVLRRKVNQSILIGDSIRVVVVGVEGDHVKIGVEAPRNVSVHRSELLDKEGGEGKPANGRRRAQP